jgi:hypothetical protein
MIIHNGQATQFLSVVEVICYKVHAPALVLLTRGNSDLSQLWANLGALFLI